MDQFVTA
jgi:hypothetical protein